MPFGIIVVAIVLMIAAIRGSHNELITLVKGDFSGPNSFLPWIAALFLLYLISMYEPLAPVSNAFMTLVVVVLLLTSGRGFFDQFNKQLKEIAQ
jgi:hypothetical protein